MDKNWIKVVLIAAFVVSLIFVFAGAYRAMREPHYAAFEPPPAPMAPTPPSLVQVDPSTPAAAQQLEVLKQQVAAYAEAVKSYDTAVTAYAKDVDARTTAWKAKNGDPNTRVSVYEKVVKDTLGSILVTPLLAALLIYSGIQVGGEVTKAKFTRDARAEVKAP